MAKRQRVSRQCKLEVIQGLDVRRKPAANMAHQFSISLLLFLLVFAGRPAADMSLSEADLKGVTLGQSDQAAVIEALGEPDYEYGYWTPKGETPVRPHSGTESNYPGQECEKLYEKLWILAYNSGDETLPFLIVLRNGTLDYWVGPTSADERKAEAIETRYGKADMWTWGHYSSHFVIYFDVVSYEKAGVAFVRRYRTEEFTAKLVARKVPTGTKPKERPPEYYECKSKEIDLGGGGGVDDDL